MPRRGGRDRCRASGKSKFTSWDKAAGAGQRVDGDNTRPYWCPRCGFYHFTGSEKRKRGSRD